LEQEIANKIVEHLSDLLPGNVLGSTGFWIVSTLVLLSIIALGAFGAAYVKKLGENYASKEDIDELLEKTEALTQIAEETKLEVKLRFEDRQLALQLSLIHISEPTRPY